MQPLKHEIISLFRKCLKFSNQISNYNFREHAKRKVKYEFKKSMQLKNAGEIESTFVKGMNSMDVLRRQSIISQLYPETQSVIH
eukprot:gene15238-20538_t